MSKRRNKSRRHVPQPRITPAKPAAADAPEIDTNGQNQTLLDTPDLSMSQPASSHSNATDAPEIDTNGQNQTLLDTPDLSMSQPASSHSNAADAPEVDTNGQNQTLLDTPDLSMSQPASSHSNAAEAPEVDTNGQNQTLLDTPDLSMSQPASSHSNAADAPEVDTNGQNQTLLDTPDLSPRQLAALPLIVDSPTNAQAARDAGIARATLYKWLDDPDFRAELIRVREESAAFARTEVCGTMIHSLSVIIDCTYSQNDFVRFQAARYLYNTGLAVGGLEQLQKQLDALKLTLETAQQSDE